MQPSSTMQKGFTVHLRSALAALFFASIGALAHGQAVAGQTPALLVAPPSSQDCPVGLFARRHAAGLVAYAGKAPVPTRADSLLVDFQQLETPRLVHAEITAHGASGDAHATPASTSSAASAAETFELNRHPGAASLRHASLPLRKLTAVAWIELTAIGYADGTAWHPSPGSRCIAEPNGLLLVSTP